MQTNRLYEKVILPHEKDSDSQDWTSTFCDLEELLSTPLILPTSERLTYRSLLSVIFQKIGGLNATHCDKTEKDQPSFTSDSYQQPSYACITRWLKVVIPTLNQYYFDFKQNNPNIDEESLKQKYLSYLASDGLREILEKHPVIIRLWAIIYQNTSLHLQKVIKRFETDRQSIQNNIFAGEPIGQIQDLQSELSDPHGNGKTVVILTLSDGKKIVYKARGLDADLFFEDFANHLNQWGYPLALISPKVMDQQSYGWAEFIVDESPSKSNLSDEQAQNIGLLMALAHAVGVTDLHVENFAIVTDKPLMWDMETFLRPRLLLGRKGNEYHPLWRSLLSHYENSIVGIGIVNDQNKEHTDSFQQSAKTWEYIIEGFKEGYLWLLNNQKRLLKLFPERPELSFRVIVSETESYYQIQTQSYHPQALQTIESYFQHLNNLHNAQTVFSEIEEFCKTEEINALLRQDIPAFYWRGNQFSEASGRHFCLRERDENSKTAMQNARQKILQISNHDFRIQNRMLKFHQQTQSVDKKNIIHNDPLDSSFRKLKKGKNNPDFLEEINQIQTTIKEAAVVTEHGIGWLSNTFSKGEVARLAPMTHQFYDGILGPALFFGALYFITKKNEPKEWVYHCLQAIRHDINHPERLAKQFNYLGIGGVSGITSAIYVFSLLSTWLNDKSFIDDAQKILYSISRDRIQNDQQFDIIAGSAGMILCAIKLYKETNIERELQIAKSFADHLIKHKPAPEKMAKSALGGFSHGAAGFSLALTQLNQFINDPQYKLESDKWKQFEKGLKNLHNGHYRDLRQQEGLDKQNHFSAWCHGAAGIGLARSSEYILTKSPQDLQTVEQSVSTLREYPLFRDRDHLCCGSYGNIEILHTIGQTLNRPELIELASNAAQQCWPKENKELRWTSGTNQDNIGFFNGISGIGYTLLRLANPNHLPCVLRFD